MNDDLNKIKQINVDIFNKCNQIFKIASNSKSVALHKSNILDDVIKIYTISSNVVNQIENIDHKKIAEQIISENPCLYCGTQAPCYEDCYLLTQYKKQHKK